jgi:hypothetical protein
MSFRGILLGALTGFLLLHFLNGGVSIDALWRVLFLVECSISNST